MAVDLACQLRRHRPRRGEPCFASGDILIQSGKGGVSLSERTFDGA
ncbi:hypothetical protein [Sphingobium sp. Z007]|nr:hypothetical protein [Sphingobium sp. Z007]